MTSLVVVVRIVRGFSPSPILYLSIIPELRKSKFIFTVKIKVQELFYPLRLYAAD
jgi:hypothetical protein